jgi:hypothetical protein
MTITRGMVERRNGPGALNTGRLLRSILGPAAALVVGVAMARPVQAAPPAYLHLPEPQLLALAPQAWEGDQQPHTMSVLELNRDGYRYWAWYGLNNGRGMGLMRSNDLMHWTKFDRNPLWLNARWPSVLLGADPAHPHTLYFAITRDYDTPSSRIVLASSEDGIQLTELKNLVPPVPKQRNQNPNLFRDPVTKRYFLTFYRGNDEDYFDIVSKSAASIGELYRAPDKILMHTTETVAAPNLLYLPKGGPDHKGIYYLATEIYPNRYNDSGRGVWQVKVFYAGAADGPFQPVAGNPVQTGERACLFQHVFNGNFYGYQSHLDHATDKWQMEVLRTPLPN